MLRNPIAAATLSSAVSVLLPFSPVVTDGDCSRDCDNANRVGDDHRDIAECDRVGEPCAIADPQQAEERHADVGRAAPLMGAQCLQERTGAHDDSARSGQNRK